MLRAAPQRGPGQHGPGGLRDAGCGLPDTAEGSGPPPAPLCSFVSLQPPNFPLQHPTLTSLTSAFLEFAIITSLFRKRRARLQPRARKQLNRAAEGGYNENILISEKRDPASVPGCAADPTRRLGPALPARRFTCLACKTGRGSP